MRPTSRAPRQCLHFVTFFFFNETFCTRGDAIFGTMDSYLIWKLTGGKLHITDVTNASRTLLMSLRELKWDQGILQELG